MMDGKKTLTTREKRARLEALLRQKAENVAEASPLSHGQQALWFLYRSAPESAAYNTAFAARIASPFDCSAAQQAFQALSDRHPLLRTTFSVQDGEPVQRAHDRQEVFFEKIDASAWSDDELQRQVSESYKRPFDLERGPVFRVAVFTRSDTDHVLLLAFHHIVCDAWSIWMVANEFRELYAGLELGRMPGLPLLTHGYQDYARWQSALLAGPEGERQWQYWREQLSGTLPDLQLPTDRPRPPIQSYRGASYDFAIPSDLTQQLRELAKAESVTLYMLLLSAFAILLHRYSGQDDLLIGSPVAGRSKAEFAGIVGYFVNQIVLRVNLSGNPSYREFLKQARQIVLGAIAHQDYPFPLLVQKLRPVREPDRSPLFQAYFILQQPQQAGEFADLLSGENSATAAVGGLKFEPFDMSQMEGQFDFTLEITDVQASLSAIFKYNPDIFDAAAIARAADHFTTLLRSIAANPQARAANLPILTNGELRQLQEWNATARAYPLEKCLHRLFEEQVERMPQSVALIYEQERLTYRELNKRANQLAWHLQGLGVGPDVLTGICVERSVEMVVGLYGILKAGGAYIPIDPDYPAERLRFMLADARPSVLLTQEKLLTRLPAAGQTTVICLDRDWPRIAQQRTDNPNADVKPEHLAYMIYTSGSTGTPKGALNTHRGICNRLHWMQEVYQLTGQDRVVQKTPFSFDVSVWEFFWPLISGASLVVAKPGGHQDSAYLIDLIVSQRVTTVHFVPSMLRIFLESPQVERCNAALRQVMCSGEALPYNAQQRFFERLQADLHNLYGPTEAAVDVTFWQCERSSASRIVPIGRPIANTQIYILDRFMQPVPIGVPGELHIGGVNVGRGYWRRPGLTAEKFLPDPFTPPPAPPQQAGELDPPPYSLSRAERENTPLSVREGPGVGLRLYKTGDLARYLPDGAIEYLGRIDQQVKLRGFRIELGEIEAALTSHPAVREAAVLMRTDRSSESSLIAYLSLKTETGTGQRLDAQTARRFLAEKLPEYMAPAHIVFLDALPLSPNGKLDRRALPAPPGGMEAARPQMTPQNELEAAIRDIWQDVLKLDQFGLQDNFFDLGGHSLRLAQVQNALAARLQRNVPMVELFQYPTIAALAAHLKGDEAPLKSSFSVLPELSGRSEGMPRTEDIAIIGMACRFPGAENLAEFWQNLCQGVESVSVFSDAELLESGEDPEVFTQSNYVRARAILADVETFDAAFFGVPPREAEILDPQHRLFLECAWNALEHAGYDPERYAGIIGVYAGVSLNSYLLNCLYRNPELIAAIDMYQLLITNDKDFLPTRTAYKLNLKGPAVNVQTACSTSLVAAHLACQSILRGECDMALAGGVCVSVPQKRGYLYREGMILSPDGHCRAFDANAKGIVGGNGVGCVTLKRLDRALADGDYIHAIIKGSAVNNDGSEKIGYTAPGVEGQAAVIASALRAAGVSPDTVEYIEAHGTGTALGDPIEIAALTKVFRAVTQRTGFCALGSAKTNIGHLDAAAGVAGLIKTALALEHRLLPPIVNFSAPNPQIDFASSPFFVNAVLKKWTSDAEPCRAGVSSFGIGGTNAHVVLQEAPPRVSTPSDKPYQLLPLSAKTGQALERRIADLARHLAAQPDANLADVAYTLSEGRRAFSHRAFLIAKTLPEAVEALNSPATGRITRENGEAEERPLMFLFSGQGTQYVMMGRELYDHEPIFRDTVDCCAEILAPHLHCDLRTLLYPDERHRAEAERQLRQTAFTQPALFVIEYALAQMWMAWGIQPKAMLGHSLGEYAAACVAGVFALEDALALVAERGRMMQTLPEGSMLAVMTPEEDVLPLLSDNVCLAAVNAPSMCVVSGTNAAIARLERELADRGIRCAALRTSHAFHSSMMDSILPEFTRRVEQIALRPPQIPYISNVTGTWITAEEATNPAYWATHLRQTVRFADGMANLLHDAQAVCLEIGPGKTLAGFCKRHPAFASTHRVLTSLPHAEESQPAAAFALTTLGRLWAAGVPINWQAYFSDERRLRLPLPTYPFERQRFWIDARTPRPESLRKAHNFTDWIYLPSWERSLPPGKKDSSGEKQINWLVFADEGGMGKVFAGQLADAPHNCVTIVRPGAEFGKIREGEYALNPRQVSDYHTLLQELRDQNRLPHTVVHFWLASDEPEQSVQFGKEALEQAQYAGFYSVVFLAQALDAVKTAEPTQIRVISANLFDVVGTERLNPGKATVMGAITVIPQEMEAIRCGVIDVMLPLSGNEARQQITRRILAECDAGLRDAVVAYRGGHRWIQSFIPARPDTDGSSTRCRICDGGVYWIAGGLGGVGLELAEHLARAASHVKLILSGRSGFAAHQDWEMLADSGDARARRLLDLEASGADILILAADVCDLSQMRAALTQAHERFGSVHGVIHAAGLAEGRTVLRCSPDQIELEVAAKIYGTLALREIFQDESLDFFLLCSSLNAITGSVGLAAYSAANAFQDAFAYYQRMQGETRTLSINWDRWQHTGMATNAEALHQKLTGEALRGGMTAAEGREIFQRLLCGWTEPQAVISTLPLQDALTHSRKFQLDAPSAPPVAQRHERPDLLPTHFVPPGTEIEQTIARIWEDVLGIAPIGLHDHFLELGGDSLIAISVIARLRDACGVELPARSVYDDATVAALAQRVSALQWAVNAALPGDAEGQGEVEGVL